MVNIRTWEGLYMKKAIIIAIVMLLLVSGGLLAIMNNPETTSIKVVVTGTEGQRITGQYTADGVKQTIERVLPTEISIEAKRLSMLIESQDDTKGIFAQVFVNDQQRLGGQNQCIQIEVSGQTLLSSSREYLIASDKPLP